MRIFGNYVTLALLTFILHFIWENAHIGLYGGYEALPFSKHITLFATVGDVAYTLITVLLFALFKKNINWFIESKSRDYILLAVLGFFIALFVEYKALALGRWFYLPAMPIIPFLKVGLSPILQMTLLLPLSVFIASKSLKRGLPKS